MREKPTRIGRLRVPGAMFMKLGILDQVGTLEKGKQADVVLWSGDPFSVYSKAERVYNDGWLVFDRSDTTRQYRTDFNIGITQPGVGQ